jgi:hypothetical protein
VGPTGVCHEESHTFFFQGRNGGDRHRIWSHRRRISVAIIAVVQGLGTNLKNTFSSVSTALK